MATRQSFSKFVQASSVLDTWYDNTNFCMTRQAKRAEVLQALRLQACPIYNNYLITGEIVCTKSM